VGLDRLDKSSQSQENRGARKPGYTDQYTHSCAAASRRLSGAQPCFPGPILARWTSHPEPVFPIADQGRVVHIPDFAKMIAGRKVDVHNHDDQQSSVAVKFEGEAAIHLFTNESYLFPRWQNPAWRLETGTYRLRVTAYYERGRAVGDFELAPRREKLGWRLQARGGEVQHSAPLLSPRARDCGWSATDRPRPGSRLRLPDDRPAAVRPALRNPGKYR